MSRPRYSDHLDVLVALTTYLALTPWASRTVPGLARDLSLPPEDVRAAVEGFPGVFRRSRNLSAEGEPYFTLHARYALRKADTANEAQVLVELRSDLLSTVLAFIAQQASHESTFEQFSRQQRHTLHVTWLAVGASIIAAAMAALATVVAG
jgi:hypothetical protein